MARAMLTDSEQEAVAILRMLNNSNNEAFELLDSYVHDPIKSVAVLKKLLVSGPEKISRILPGRSRLSLRRK